MGNSNSNVSKSTVGSGPITAPTGLPAEVLNDMGFKSINETITRFESVALEDIIVANSNTRFIESINKTCYTLNYNTLNVTQEKTFKQTEQTAANYIERPIHSLIGEENDILLYTYSPNELLRFIEVNKNNKYTFLPLTVHAANSASGKRNDMLIIFQNRTKQMYWFDSRIHTGYLATGRSVPRDAIDILLTVLVSVWNLGYTYEAAESWIVAGLFNPVSSLGKFDFLLTTTWCYLIVKMMPHFDMPHNLMAALDSLTREDRFNLLYTANYNMTSRHFYATTINKQLTTGCDYDKFDPIRNNDAGTLKQDNYFQLNVAKQTPRVNPKTEVDPDAPSAPSAPSAPFYRGDTDVDTDADADADADADDDEFNDPNFIRLNKYSTPGNPADECVSLLSASAPMELRNLATRSDSLAPSSGQASTFTTDYKNPTDIREDLALKYAIEQSLKDISTPISTPAPSSSPSRRISHNDACDLMKLPLRLNFQDSEIDVERCWENVVKRIADPSSDPYKDFKTAELRQRNVQPKDPDN